jgi:hypothetical protein
VAAQAERFGWLSFGRGGWLAECGGHFLLRRVKACVVSVGFSRRRRW